MFFLEILSIESSEDIARRITGIEDITLHYGIVLEQVSQDLIIRLSILSPIEEVLNEHIE